MNYKNENFCIHFVLFLQIMKYKDIYNLLKTIISDPKGFWENTQAVSENRNSILKGFAYPLILFTGLSALVGNIFAIASTEYSIVYILVSATFLMLSLLVSMFIIFILIKELSIKYEGNSNMLAVERITIYSLSVYWATLVVSGIMANYGSMQNFIEFLGLFGTFVYFKGVDLVLNIKKEDKVIFTLFSLAIAIGVHIIVFWALGFVPDLIKNFSF